MGESFRRAACVGGFLSASAIVVRAHDPGVSTAQGPVFADRFELSTGFAPADAQQLIPASARSAEKSSGV